MHVGYWWDSYAKVWVVRQCSFALPGGEDFLGGTRSRGLDAARPAHSG